MEEKENILNVYATSSTMMGACDCGNTEVTYTTTNGNVTIATPEETEGTEYYYIIRNISDTDITVTYPNYDATTSTFSIPAKQVGELSLLWFNTPRTWVGRWAITEK